LKTWEWPHPAIKSIHPSLSSKKGKVCVRDWCHGSLTHHARILRAQPQPHRLYIKSNHLFNLHAEVFLSFSLFFFISIIGPFLHYPISQCYNQTIIKKTNKPPLQNQKTTLSSFLLKIKQLSNSSSRKGMKFPHNLLSPLTYLPRCNLYGLQHTVPHVKSLSVTFEIRTGSGSTPPIPQTQKLFFYICLCLFKALNFPTS